jgi:predicted amidohydrolase
MRACVAQTNPINGDISRNIEAHKKLTGLAAQQAADIIIFPELSITGYVPIASKELATTAADNTFDVFQTLSDQHNLTIGIGAPLRFNNGITISLIIFQPQLPRDVYHKKHVHPDEEPFFVSRENTIGLIGPERDVALAICYETAVPAHGEDAQRFGAKVYIASSAKSRAKIEFSLERMAQIAREHSMITLMSDCVGSAEGREFAGRSSAWDNTGNLTGQLDESSEGILIYDAETGETTSLTL